jgi:2-oxoglutarate dehydrogenase E2 component (dihydrolipoamide succinyltransferase)
MRIAVCGAVMVGGAGGGLAAWFSPGSGAQPIAPSSAAPAIAQPAPSKAPSAAPSVVPSASPAQRTSPAAPDPQVAIATQMRTVLARFAEWSRDHAGAPCPDGAALGVATLDPWGHPIELTCTDQPADQMIGANSGGSDGVMGNDDDVASWTLGRDVTDLVRGARWKSAHAATAPSPATNAKRTKERRAAHAHPPAPPAPPATTPAAPAPSTTSAGPPPTTPASKPSAPPIDAGADDIPARR